MKKLQNSKGFSLIELLMVVAIIGILSMFAIPAYNNYTERAKVAGAFSALAAWQVAIEQCIQDRGAATQCNNTNVPMIPADISANNNGATVKYIDQASTSAGVITATTTAVDSSGSKLTLTYTPSFSSGFISWNITGTGCTTKGRSVDCN